MAWEQVYGVIDEEDDEDGDLSGDTPPEPETSDADNQGGR